MDMVVYEDIAGGLIVLTILFSVIVSGHESGDCLFNPKPVTHLLALVIASIVGFVGNEAVAIFRIRVSKEISSAALIADGYNARVDGWTSLAVLVGAVGVWMGYPIVDPMVWIPNTWMRFGTRQVTWKKYEKYER